MRHARTSNGTTTIGGWRAALAVVVTITLAGMVAGVSPSDVRAAPARPGAGLQALTPARLLDTRPGTQTIDNRYVGTGPLGAASSLDVEVTGRGGVPATGVAAVVLNVTATGPTATTYVTVWPTGAARPNASTLNTTDGMTVANSIIVGVGTDGKVSVYNDAGDTFLILDVAGWFAAGGGFSPTVPSRLMDTRTGASTIDGAYAGIGAVGANSAIALRVSGRGDVPDGAAAVALNVTVTEPTATSYVTVWPSGTARPNASNLNMTSGATVANLVTVGVGSGGEVSLYNESGATHLIVDVVGWFTADGSYQPITPARIADFRASGVTVDGADRGDAVLAPGESRPIRIVGRAGLPAAAVAAVVLNVTITEPTATSFITVSPGGVPRPNASSLNVRAGQTVANAVVVKVGANGEVNVFNESGQSRLIIDVLGWFGSTAQQQTALDVGGAISAHACAVGRDANAWCWGDNLSGQTGQVAGGTQPSPAAVAGTTGTVAVAAGDAFSCAVLRSATVSCWGQNESGQLGDGTVTARPDARPVLGISGVTAVAAGRAHACAVLTDGSLRCWGANSDGQLGNGTTSNTGTPVTVVGLDAPAVAVTAGGDHTCAVLATGGLRCWGENGLGELGIGNTANATAATDTGLIGVTAASAGTHHTCAALVDGSVRCWGANPDGRLGTADTDPRLVPAVVVGLPAPVTSIAAGPSRSCVTTTVGYAYCWGNNANRSLGNGSNDALSTTPVPVAGITDGVGVAVGRLSTCAALADGTARCWGHNGFGELGDGTTTSSGSPVAVKIP